MSYDFQLSISVSPFGWADRTSGPQPVGLSVHYLSKFHYETERFPQRSSFT